MRPDPLRPVTRDSRHQRGGHATADTAPVPPGTSFTRRGVSAPAPPRPCAGGAPVRVGDRARVGGASRPYRGRVTLHRVADTIYLSPPLTRSVFLPGLGSENPATDERSGFRACTDREAGRARPRCRQAVLGLPRGGGVRSPRRARH